MKVFGLNFNEGAKVSNLVVPSGASFPNNPNPGELFWLLNPAGLYLYTTEWINVVTRRMTPAVYNPSGQLDSPKIFTGTTTSNSSGVWSINISGAGFSSPPVVTANVVATGANAYDKSFATITSVTTTTITGTVVKGNNVVVLAGAVVLFAGSQTVSVMAIGK